MAKLYLGLNIHYHDTSILDWFGQKKHFEIAMGADGAPFGKNVTATSFLIWT
jgi:hypothetical protein